jgi:hypothetical protein
MFKPTLIPDNPAVVIPCFWGGRVANRFNEDRTSLLPAARLPERQATWHLAPLMRCTMGFVRRDSPLPFAETLMLPGGLAFTEKAKPAGARDVEAPLVISMTADGILS